MFDEDRRMREILRVVIMYRCRNRKTAETIYCDIEIAGKVTNVSANISTQ